MFVKFSIRISGLRKNFRLNFFYQLKKTYQLNNQLEEKFFLLNVTKKFKKKKIVRNSLNFKREGFFMQKKNRTSCKI